MISSARQTDMGRFSTTNQRRPAADQGIKIHALLQSDIKRKGFLKKRTKGIFHHEKLSFIKCK
jgi:hypothetical protein